MIFLAIITTLVILFSFPVVGYRILKAYKSGDFKRLKKQIAIFIALILLPGFFWQVLPGSKFLWGPFHRAQDREFNEELTGYSFEYGETLHEYNSERAFNGDGYSIKIIELDQETAEYFHKPYESFFSLYPRTSFRSEWRHKSWQKTPIKNSEKEVLDFTLHDDVVLSLAINDLLREAGNYYAYEYNMHNYGNGDSNIGDIDFYIICPERKLFVKVNYNT